MADADVNPPDLARLYRAERDRLRRLAYLMTGQVHVADEIVQDAFLRIHPRLPDVETPPAYLRATVVNLCLGWRRRTAMAREREPRPERAWADPPEIDETWDLLARLPADQRAVLVLRYYEDLPVAEIAAVLGCRPSTARSRLHRALVRLREEMTQ
ncbi:MAG TPA: sigma-70 family RNA polymerase sigma factor [Acidimicrobiales bacterium]|jgi:RNA polymerase sigma factor (sigma-70 family)